MYESPFKIIKTYTETVAKAAAEFLDDEVFKAAFSVGVTVDKDELLRALRYDRDQYNRGFNDGIMAAAEELVHCKDCHYSDEAKVNEKGFLICPASGMEITDDDFCSYGERRSDD